MADHTSVNRVRARARNVLTNKPFGRCDHYWRDERSLCDQWAPRPAISMDMTLRPGPLCRFCRRENGKGQ